MKGILRGIKGGLKAVKLRKIISVQNHSVTRRWFEGNKNHLFLLGFVKHKINAGSVKVGDHQWQKIYSTV